MISHHSVSCLLLAQAGPKGPAQVQHTVYAEDLVKNKSAARPFSYGFSRGPQGPPLYMVSFMDPPLLFIMVSELIKVLPFKYAVLAKWQHP